MTLQLSDITDTYRGGTGCACGCTGTYAKPNSRAGKMRLDFINKNLDKVNVMTLSRSEAVYEVENEDGTRVTRLYVRID